MTPLPESPQAIRFPGWELRPQERLLLVRGQPAKIGRRALDLLCALAERQGRVASKDELLAKAWPGLVVEENNLSVQIAALRKILGPHAIVNVSGVGYRLSGESGPGLTKSPTLLEGSPRAIAPELFGRDEDLYSLLPLVGQEPLVSIVGTGGVGKTSLAKALLARSSRHWPDGMHWIDLAPVLRGAPLMQLMAQSLGVLPEDRDHASDDLALALSQMQALIAVDNCEHVLDEVAAIIGPLLRQAPGIRWLATSQQPLQLAGESVYRLGPLEVPPREARLEQAVECGALALFCKRAQAADRHFELTSDGLVLAADICRQLDGLPLAIEMAAARVGTLGLRGVHEQIGQRLRLRAGTRDAPTRHQTLVQTFEWSCALLTPVELRVFRRLHPFRGGFHPQMAEQLCCLVDGDAGSLEPWRALDALSSLVDRSLVQRASATPGGAHRLHLLESARDYADFLLEGARERDAVRRAHASVVANWFDAALDDLNRWRDSDWAVKYLSERSNVDVALSWACAARDPDLLARLVAAMSLLDNFARMPAEIVRHDVPLEELERAALPLRARAYLEFGWAHYFDANRKRGTELVQRALSDFEVLGDPAGVYSALHRLARLCHGRPGMQDEARRLWLRLQAMNDEFVPLRVRLEHQCTWTLPTGNVSRVERLRQLHHVAQVAGYDAQAAVCRANLVDALLVEERFEEAVETANAMLQGDEPWLRIRAMICHNKALALVRLGRHDEARGAAAVMLRGLPGEAHMVMDILALAAVQEGRLDEGALIAGCSAQVKRERDRCSETAEDAVIVETMKRLDNELGMRRTKELIRIGNAMPVADILRIALSGS